MSNSKMFENILGAMKKMNDSGGSSNKDNENMWRAEQDKAGNGFAIIRFLPARSEDDLPFVKIFDHGFQGPTGKWFIEKCPTTIGQNCPVCEANGPLWNSGRDSDKEIVRKRKRRQSYITNVLVISDPKNPDNEGKVFKFKIGKKIFEKLMDAMQPPVDEKGNPIDPDEVPMNPFDLVEGANFKLKIRKVEGYANFDKSEFEAPSAVENADEVLSQVHDLQMYVDPTTFKDYDTLEAKFNQVVSSKQAPARKTADQMNDDLDEDDIPFKKEKAEPAKTKAKPASKPAKEEANDDDDDLDYFRKLAGGDGDD
jgi:hypothetical protein